MILTIIIILILIGSFLRGRRRGLLRMVLNLISYVIAIGVARFGAVSFGNKLADWFPTVDTASTSGTIVSEHSGNQFLYNGLAFIILFVVVLLICHWIVRKLNLITKVPVIHQLNGAFGGLISLVISYVTIFLLLTVFQVWPSDWWQAQLTASNLATWIIDNTPGLSNQVVYWLINR